MIEQAAIEEVRAILALGLDPAPGDAGPWRARASAYLSGDSSLEAAVQMEEDREPLCQAGSTTWLRRFRDSDAPLRPSPPRTP